MAVQDGKMKCTLYKGAFSGEVVFAVDTLGGEGYEGIAPLHYANPNGSLSSAATGGSINVRVISNGGQRARVSMPDGETIDIEAALIE